MPSCTQQSLFCTQQLTNHLQAKHLEEYKRCTNDSSKSCKTQSTLHSFSRDSVSTGVHYHHHKVYCWVCHAGSLPYQCCWWAGLHKATELPWTRVASSPGHSQIFSPRLWDKIWEWPGDEARTRIQSAKTWWVDLCLSCSCPFALHLGYPDVENPHLLQPYLLQPHIEIEQYSVLYFIHIAMLEGLNIYLRVTLSIIIVQGRSSLKTSLVLFCIAITYCCIQRGYIT